MWNDSLIEMIRAAVPCYSDSHLNQITGALDKLHQHGAYKISIAPEWSDEAIVAAVKEYATVRDSEDS